MGNHGKEAHLALESQIWSCLTNPLVATTQRLDWGKKKSKEHNSLDNHNSRTNINWKRFLRNQFWKIVSAIELTKEWFLICKKTKKTKKC